MTTSIRVLIADDHAIVREGIATLIESEPGMELVGEAGDGVQALQLARELKPDVLLLDIVMPGKSGLDVIEALGGADSSIPILVLTSYDDEDIVFPAIKAGATGYLLKNTSPLTLLRAIRDVHQGQPTMSPAIARKLMAHMQAPSDLPPTQEPLTDRELQVIELLAQGLTNVEIGERLFIETGTVRTHVSNILNKLHLANRTQAALYAVREGLAPLWPEVDDVSTEER